MFEKLGQEILINSGGIGTALRKSEMSVEVIEQLNVAGPEVVAGLHQNYREAGSNILVANTFAANPYLLAEAGLEDLCDEINAAGVRIAREVAGKSCMVWASVGPLALGLRHDDFSPQQLLDIYSRHCKGLAEADAVILETMTDPREARAAVEAVSALKLPFVFSIGNVGGGGDKWNRIDALLEIAQSRDPIAVGTNCRHPNEIVEVARYLVGHTHLPVTASPNAGHPRIERGAVTYDFSPTDLAAIGRVLVSSGVSVVGGCCGTSPAHIRALADAVSGGPVIRVAPVTVTREPVVAREAPARGTNRVREVIGKEDLVVSVEVRADRKTPLPDIVEGARRIADAGADLFDVPDNPGATVGRDAMVVAARLQDELGIASFCHKSVTQVNLLQAHSTLIGCWDLGLHGLLAVTGDPPSMGHLGEMAKLVADIRSSVELIRLVRSMRKGEMINGELIGDPPDLCVGCALGGHRKSQLQWLTKKIDAGAEFVFSQPVFDEEDLLAIKAAVEHLPIRFFPGIMPLTSKRSAEFLAAGRIPGIRVPQEVVDSFDRWETAADQRKHGLECAAELGARAGSECNSVYLIMPFGKNCCSDTADLVRAIKK